MLEMEEDGRYGKKKDKRKIIRLGTKIKSLDEFFEKDEFHLSRRGERVDARIDQLNVRRTSNLLPNTIFVS